MCRVDLKGYQGRSLHDMCPSIGFNRAPRHLRERFCFAQVAAQHAAAAAAEDRQRLQEARRKETSTRLQVRALLSS
jgi:hypothetical protein